MHIRKIPVVAALVLLSAFKIATGVFDFNINASEGDEQALSDYAGKKMMIVVLPVTQTGADTALLQLLDTLSVRYADSVTMIGIPAYEYGFADDSLGSLLPWWQSLIGEQFIISGGMSVTKGSAYQSPLFSYLTHAEENRYFDEDVQGAGEKFFIDVSGNLTGISLPDADFNETIFLAMLNHEEEGQ